MMIMKILKKLLFLLLAFLLFLVHKESKGQGVSFTVNAPQQVGAGDQFRVVFSLNDAGTSFKGPSFKGFSVLSGPSQSTSSNIQFINGAMTQSVNYSFTYILQADKEGTYQVEPASITVQGKQFRTNAFNIQVLKGSPNRQRQGGGGQSGGNQGGANISGNDLFIKTLLSKPEAYQGEQITVTQKIYSRVALMGFENVKLPSFEGFWSSEVKMPEQVSLHKETVNGTVYNVAELKKTILFPQKSGTLTIQPMTVTAVVQVRTQGRTTTGDPFFDNFFNGSGFGSSVQNVRKEIKSAPVSIRVKPLPEQSQPAGFGGAVGSFSLKATLDKTEVKANEALNYKITLSGTGNLELVDDLKVEFPSDFEVYDPKISNNISASASGVTGNRIFEYLVIPRNPGDYEIPPLKFSYFDLGKKAYVDIQAAGFTIKVQKGAGGSTAAYTAAGKEDVKILGSDIRYIKTGRPQLRPIGAMFYQTALFWGLFVIPIVLFGLVILIWNRHMRLRGDQSLMKNRKATRVAKARMKKAAAYLKSGEEEAFYVEVSQALWGYLADKLYLPQATLSLETVHEALEKKGVGEALRLRYESVLQECEFIRFAPGDKAGKMEGLYQQSLEIVMTAEKEIS